MARPWKVVDLDPNENMKACLYKILQTRFQETFSYEQSTIKGDDPEALHDMRVAARRLRAILRMFRECFPKKKFKKHDEELQGLIRSLGAVRELDVFIRLLEARRGLLSQREGRAIDLLLARERNKHTSFQKKLRSELRFMQRAHYPEMFSRFLLESF